MNGSKILQRQPDRNDVRAERRGARFVMELEGAALDFERSNDQRRKRRLLAGIGRWRCGLIRRFWPKVGKIQRAVWADPDDPIRNAKANVVERQGAIEHR